MFEIIEMKVMRGPNLWSDHNSKLIVLKVKIDSQSNKNILAELKKIFSEVHTEQSPLNETAEAIKAAAIAIQKKAGFQVEYGKVHPYRQEGIFWITYSYELEEAGRSAGTYAVQYIESIVNDTPFNFNECIEELKELRSDNDMGATTSFLLSEVIKRNIPYKRFDNGSLITLGYGCKQKKMRTAVVDSTSGIGIELAGDKEETKKMLEDAKFPVPKGAMVYDAEELLETLKEMQFPIVTKPLDGNHGRGVTTNINTIEQAIHGLNVAQKISKAVIVEEFIQGDDHRFLVINYKLVAVAKRTPACVTGDGKSTIDQLIEEENKHPDRGNTQQHPLALIKIDDVTKKILSERSLTIESVLPKGETLYLKQTANISAGGTSTDVTDLVHPENVFMAEHIARLFNLNICGIDLLTKDVSVPLTKKTGAIIEVNAGPGIRMHTDPTEGIPRNVAKPIIDMLFPDDDTKIPIIAISGTNGKTTTTRLTAHILKESGKNIGYTTTEGIYINDHVIESGDCTGSVSAQTVLFDPTVEIAVLECARGGILRAGLGFDKCDISIITNISDDHLGTKDIETLEELAKVKSVVAKSTKKDGYTILNADDDLVYNMQQFTNCKVAVFSMDENNPRIKAHCENGGVAAVIEEGYLTIYNGEWKTRIDKVENIPLSFGGKAEFMIQNILAASLAVMIMTDFDPEILRKGLHSFIPSPEKTPGRLNVFKFRDFDLIIDYAHNKSGYMELKKFLDKTEACEKIGIIAATGDRRDEDIRNLGRYAAQMFDNIIIRHDVDLRGRPEEEHSKFLIEGIHEINKNIPVKVIPDEKEAISYAISQAKKGSMILACADNVHETIAFVKETKAKEQQLNEI
ncbi:MAG: cyanophycin synthetase [Bacteroidetes bacterium]|jgi:cyanophycin synthetase|nr:cyanophycin synthetase [Bacteroidota bacterium]